MKLSRIAQLEAEIAAIKAQRKSQDPEVKQVLTECHVSLQRFIDSNVLPMIRTDIHGRIFEANKSFLELVGHSREDFTSGKVLWHDLTPPEYRELDAIAIEQLKTNGLSKPWEKVYICKDGTRKNVLLAVIAADTTGEDCFAFIVDKTEQKRLESEIKRSELRFKRLAEAMPDIVWIADTNGRTTYHNQRFYDYTGVAVHEDDGWAWTDHVAPEDRTPFLQRVQQAKENKSSFEFEYRYRSKNAEYKWHLSRGLPIFDDEGNVIRFLGTCTEIDQGKGLEEELRESEARFHTMANAIPQILWTAKSDGTIDFFNDRWFEYTGLTYEQSTDNGWLLLIHPDDRAQYLEGWRNALATGDSYEAEFRLKRAVGLGRRIKEPYRWHLCRAVALSDASGKTTQWFATWTEIEDHKRAQQSANE